MYYSENKPCPCSSGGGDRRQTTIVYTNEPSACGSVCPISSQLVAPDVNVSIPTATTEERYTGFVPYTADRFDRPVFDYGRFDRPVFDYGNAMIPPAAPSSVSIERYEAAVAAFYSALGVGAPEYYDYKRAPPPGPIPIEANAYASLPADYAESFTPMRGTQSTAPLEVTVYGTVSKWR